MRGLWLALVLWAGMACSAVAEPARYVVGVEELDYFPVYAIRDGDYVGAAREILDAFAADAGIAFTYQPLPVKRLFAELAGGGIDFKFPDNPYWSPDAKAGRTVTYSDAVVTYIDGVMVRPERHGKGLQGFATLGTVTGFTPFAWREHLDGGRVRLVENAQMKPLLRQVIAGRIDGAYASVAVALQALDRDLRQPGALVFDPSLPHSKDSYFLSSIKHAGLIQRFNAWLAANAARVQAIKDRHGAETGVK